MLYFDRQVDMFAFVPKIDKFMSINEVKSFIEIPMFPNYVFVETELNEKEFYQVIEGIDRDSGSTMIVM